jgi:phosphoglycerate dehydrogenase-like enzyme
MGIERRFRAIQVSGFGDGVPPALLEALSERADRIVTGDAADGIDALVLDLGTPCPRALLDAHPRLRCIAVYGTDVSAVDTATAAERGIPVLNVPGYSDDAVAEFVFAAALSCARRLPQARAAASTPECWGPGLTGTTLRGRTLGVLGLGRIGRRTAEIARRGFDMQVRYWSRTRRSDLEAQLGIGPAPLDDLLAGSDLVAVHLPLTGETRGVLDAAGVHAVRRGAIVVSTSPSGLWDLAALERAIADGALTFITDHADEWSMADRGRWSADGAILYPGIGCTTEEAQRKKLRLFLAALSSVEAG